MNENIEEKGQIEMIAMVMVIMVLGFIQFCWDFTVDLLGMEAINDSWEGLFIYLFNISGFFN